VIVAAQSQRRFFVIDPENRVLARCAIPGDYRFIEAIYASPTTGDLFVAATSSEVVDSIYRIDAGCTHIEPIVTGVQLMSIATSADGAGLVALRYQNGRSEAVSIDRGGEIQPLGAPPLDPTARLAGARRDGSLVIVDGKYRWQLVRVDRAGHVSEVVAASGIATISVSPDRTRLAEIDLDAALRVADLARPAELGPALVFQAVATDWSPDGRRLAVLTNNSGRLTLVVVDADGKHRRDIALEDASPDSEAVWIDDGHVAYHLAGNVGYSVLDLATGAHHDLADRTPGWMFALRRAPTGALAWAWNRAPAIGIWVTPHDGEAPRQAASFPNFASPIWTNDGELLALTRSSEIVRVDLATGRTEPYVTLPTEQGLGTDAVFPLAGGDLLVKRSASVTDVELLAPER
jgi:hypothetical protein